MKIGNQFDLTYCSNIHAGEQWSEVSRALADSLPDIRAQLQYRGRFAIGLRLADAAARTLDEGSALDRFRAFLRDGDYYVPTINGFPYGAFHGTQVKQRVYEPDWRDLRRLDYSNRLARIAALLARDADRDQISISTVPGAFRRSASSPEDLRVIGAAMLAHAAFLADLYDRTGVIVQLAIEPEPACCIETVAEAAAFFREYLLTHSQLAAASASAKMHLTPDTVRRHIGVCLDACHMAVEFEDAGHAIGLLRADGISIAKVQLSSALRIEPSVETSPRSLLAPFAEDTYLHQVVIASGDKQRHYTDLPDALNRSVTATEGEEWRVHFHVPIFLDRMSGFGTTQAYLAKLIDLLLQQAISTCLEVETYTWDVLPPEYRTIDMCTAIARELSWVRDRLAL